MAPPYLSVFYLVVPPFAVPVVLRIGIRSIYTPIPLLALLALVSGGFGLVEKPAVHGILQTLLTAILGGSVLHLQGLANAPVPMLATTALFLICATLLSFSPRLFQVSPILFLIFIVATLSTTVLLFLARRRARSSVTLTLTPVLPSPTPSRVSSQYTNSEIKQPQFAFLRSPSEPDLSWRHPSLQQQTLPAPSGKTDLFLILTIQLLYIIATSLCIPTALRSPTVSSVTVVSLFATSIDHVPLSAYILHVVDIVFRIIALLLVFTAYYSCSGGMGPGSTSTSNGTFTIPRRPATRNISPTTTPTPTRLDSLILPSSQTTTFVSPIKLNIFKAKHKRDGLSASSSFFSPCPKRIPLKRTPLAPTSDLEHEPEMGRSFPYKLNRISPSPSPSSSTTFVATNPISLESDIKEHSMIDNALQFASPTCNPALVRVATPMPVLYRERAWSWAHSAHAPKNQQERDESRFTFDDEDCTELKDPFAAGLARPTVAPSAYLRWAESLKGSEVRRWSEHEIYPQTRMSTWEHLPSHQQRQGRTEPSTRIDTTVCAST